MQGGLMIGSAASVGVDVAAPVRAQVEAPAAGLVTPVVPDGFVYGGTPIVNFGDELPSSFLQPHRMHVQVGDEVEQGQRIAEVGTTGRVTARHLDRRMNLGDRRIDPQLPVPPTPAQATGSES